MEKFNFNAYLDGRERVSNFGGSELQLEPLSGSDGTDNFSPADGGYVQDNSRVMQAASAPTYQLRICNTSTVTSDATHGNFVIFGFNKYFAGVTNFGSNAGITVTPTNPNFTYAQFLAQSMQQPFVTMLIKVLPESNLFADIPAVLNFNMFDMGGDTMSSPIYTNAYLSDFQQFNQITMNVAKKIDANTYISGQLRAATSLVAPNCIIISIFPAVKANIANSIGANGSAPVRQYGAVPGVNVAPLPAGGRQVISGTQTLPSSVPLA